MGVILHIETTTSCCSVALSKGLDILAKEESFSNYTHAENLTVFITCILEKAKLQLNNIDAIAVSMGPGSYMGLRIGVSTAKGLCYALGIPLISVDTLQAMALKGAQAINNKEALYCPMLDARRMEVYCGVYDADNKVVRPVDARIINEKSFVDLGGQEICFFGDGAAKCKDILGAGVNANFDYNYDMSALSLVPIAAVKYKDKDFEDLAYFEPFYLKDFIPGTPRVKGLL